MQMIWIIPKKENNLGQWLIEQGISAGFPSPADDFKEIAEELELLNKKLAQSNQTIERLKEKTIQTSKETKSESSKITPDIIKEKAKRIINAAREHASQHKKKAEQELSILKKEVNKIKQEKINLAETVETSGQTHISQQKESQ